MWRRLLESLQFLLLESLQLLLLESLQFLLLFLHGCQAVFEHALRVL